MKRVTQSDGSKLYPATVANIREDILKGIRVKTIARTYRIGEQRIRNIFAESIQKATTERVVIIHNKALGHKTESYYTEEQLISGIPNYTWDELSKTEKQFYLNYGRKQKFNKASRNSKINRELEQSVRITDEARTRVSCSREEELSSKID